MRAELLRLQNLVQIQYERSHTTESRIAEADGKAEAALSRQHSAEKTLADMAKTIAFERNESREMISTLRTTVADLKKKLELAQSTLKITTENLRESEKKNK